MATTRERQFFTQKPREIFFETIELYNQNTGVRRFVARQFFEKQFTLESTAPRNPGQEVTFEPANMEISPFTQSDQPVVSLDIQLGRVGQRVKEMLKALDNQVDRRIECIYRQYRGDDTSQPLNVAQTLFVSNISLDGDSVALTVEDDNPGGVVIARKYLPQDFPGLEVQL